MPSRFAVRKAKCETRQVTGFRDVPPRRFRSCAVMGGGSGAFAAKPQLVQVLQVAIELLARGLCIIGPQMPDDRAPRPDYAISAKRAEPDHPLLQEVDEEIGDGDEDLVLARFRQQPVELNQDRRTPLRIVDDGFRLLMLASIACRSVSFSLGSAASRSITVMARMACVRSATEKSVTRRALVS